MTKRRRMKYLSQSNLLHFIYPETEPKFWDDPSSHELIDKSELDYIITTITTPQGTRTYRTKIT